MNCLVKVILIMMLLLLVKNCLLVLMLVAMMLTPSTPFLICFGVCLVFFGRSFCTRASLTTRLPCWRGSSEPCTSSTMRGGDHLGADSSVVTPSISSLTAPRGRSSTPPTSTTTTTGTTTARTTTRRRTTSGKRRRRSLKISCPERVLP
jgi:hypothetical protein